MNDANNLMLNTPSSAVDLDCFLRLLITLLSNPSTGGVTRIAFMSSKKIFPIGLPANEAATDPAPVTTLNKMQSSKAIEANTTTVNPIASSPQPTPPQNDPPSTSAGASIALATQPPPVVSQVCRVDLSISLHIVCLFAFSYCPVTGEQRACLNCRKPW